QHPLGVASILKESIDYAQGISDSLKRQVYEALRHVAQGFLDYSTSQLTPDDPATLKRIYDNSLILLYRLLFILYAEARELLPVRESDLYRTRYGLEAIKGEIARDLNLGIRLRANSALVWPRLRQLFQYINEGEPPPAPAGG